MPVRPETLSRPASTGTSTPASTAAAPSYVRPGFDPLRLAAALDAWAESEERAGLPGSAATARRFAAEYRADALEAPALEGSAGLG